MSYNRQIFEHKHLLTAEQMNAIDIGLADAYVELDKKQPKGDYALKTEIVKDLSQLSQNANYRTVSDAEKAVWEAKSNFSGKYEDLTGIPADLATESYVDEKLADINVDISAVSYDEIQNLSLNERTIAKNNIGVYIGSTIPTDALDGDIWIDSNASPSSTINNVNFLITITTNEDKTYSANKTFEEIYSAGYNSVAIWDGLIFRPNVFTETAIMFQLDYVGQCAMYFIFNENNTITKTNLPYIQRIPTTATITKNGNNINMNINYNNDSTDNIDIVIDENNFPTLITKNGIECDIHWNGFSE